LQANIAVIEGDGVGPEVVPQGVKVLQAIARRYGHSFRFDDVAMGYRAWKQNGTALAPEAIALCQMSDGILHGATGPGDWEYTEKDFPPGWGKRQLCRELGLRLSIRPVLISPHLLHAGPIKAERLEGVDCVILRDMTLINRAGLATTGEDERGRNARDVFEFSEAEVRPALKFAFLLAASRRNKLCLMTQSSLYATSRLWLSLFQEMSADFPGVSVEVQAPDNCAMQFVRNPASFDVIITDNTPMGGMLNNLSALMLGSIGMAPGTSVALRDGSTYAEMVIKNGMYEPIHGSAPLRAGQGIANPIATILAGAMLLRFSLAMEEEARTVERAVEAVLAQGFRTYDIMTPGCTKLGTAEMGEKIAAAVATA